MYIIVTTDQNIAEEARKVGANVFEVSGTNDIVSRLEVKEAPIENDKVIELMRMFAFKPNLKGYDYLRTILEQCIVDKKYHKRSMIKVIYSGIANKYGTTISRVERALRHSIERSFSQVPERYNQLFNRELEQQPTNSEFISTVSEYWFNSTM